MVIVLPALDMDGVAAAVVEPAGVAVALDMVDAGTPEDVAVDTSFDQHKMVAAGVDSFHTAVVHLGIPYGWSENVAVVAVDVAADLVKIHEVVLVGTPYLAAAAAARHQIVVVVHQHTDDEVHVP